MKRAGVVLLMAVITACASVPMSPTFDAMQQMQLRERAGLYVSDWTVAGDSHAAQFARLEAWAETRGIVIADAPIASKRLLGHAQYSDSAGWVILINRELSVNERLYVLLHELWHVYGPAKLVGPDSGEVIAEMTAVQVCDRIGLNVWPQTTAYLANRVPLDVQSDIAQRYGHAVDKVVAMLTRAASGA